jgi:hypothetical protein
LRCASWRRSPGQSSLWRTTPRTQTYSGIVSAWTAFFSNCVCRWKKKSLGRTT